MRRASSRLPWPELSLAGCSSFNQLAGLFKSTPPTVQLQLESYRAGRRRAHLARAGLQDALLGLVRPPSTSFLVTYTMNKYEPATIPVQVIRAPGVFLTRRDDDVRSQSGGRATAAGRPAAQASQEKAEAEETEAPKGTGRGARGRGIAVPVRTSRPRRASR